MGKVKAEAKEKQPKRSRPSRGLQRGNSQTGDLLSANGPLQQVIKEEVLPLHTTLPDDDVGLLNGSQGSLYSLVRDWYKHVTKPYDEESAQDETSVSDFTDDNKPVASTPNKSNFTLGVKMPPPLPTEVARFSIGNGHAMVLPRDVLDDRAAMLKQNIEHWKKIRRAWVASRKMYLLRYQPSYSLLDSLLVTSTNGTFAMK